MTDFIGFVVRWITFVAILVATGAVTFRLIVLGRGTLAATTRANATQRAARLGATASAMILPMAVGRLWVETAQMRFPGDPWIATAGRLLAYSTWGYAWLTQTVVALLLIPAFRMAARGTVRRWIVPAVLGVALAATPSLSSHARTAHRLAAITVTADIAHVLGAGVWLGTLAVMTMSIRGGDGRAEGASGYVSALLRTFSPLALGGAALVMLTGVLSSFAHIGTVDALVQSRYGQTLLAKLAAVLGVLLLGWRNWRRLTPGVVADGVGPMRRGMAFEVLATAIVLILTTALVVTPPPIDGMVMP